MTPAPMQTQTGVELLLQVLAEFAHSDRRRSAVGMHPRVERRSPRFQQAFPAGLEESRQLPDWTQTFRQGPVGAVRETRFD